MHYFIDPHGYDARHRDTSEQGRADGIREDYRWLRERGALCHYACNHHRPRHSAFTAKVRAA